MTKVEIRSEYLKLRLNLSIEKYESLNQNLSDNFFSKVDLSSVKTLHTFLPIIAKREPDTWLIIERLKKDFPEIRISVPKVEHNKLISFYFEGEKQLEKNKWGILEPAFGEITPTEKIDLVIVPLLAFDNKGNRVGYGKGFYDQFLSECSVGCKKIGLSFFEPIQGSIPIDAHDIPMQAAVTPSQLFAFNI